MENDLPLLLIAGGGYLAVLGLLGIAKLALEIAGKARFFSFRLWAVGALILIALSAAIWRQG